MEWSDWTVLGHFGIRQALDFATLECRGSIRNAKVEGSIPFSSTIDFKDFFIVSREAAYLCCARFVTLLAPILAAAAAKWSGARCAYRITIE
jgi:hypothetical protein